MVISGKGKKMKKLGIAILIMLIVGLTGFAQSAQADDTTDEANKPARRGSRARRGHHRPQRAKMRAVGFERMLERLAKKDAEKAEELRKLREDNPEQFRKEVRKIRTEWMLGRLERHNPERAEELRRLRKEDPKQFRKEIREYLHRRGLQGRRGERVREARGRKRPSAGRIRGPAGPKGAREHPAKPGFQKARAGRRPRHIPEAFVDWLQESYPEDTKELEALKERHPGRYRERLGLQMRKWGHIYRAWQHSPELAEVLKEDMQLKKERNEILEGYKAASEQEKEALKKQLEGVVSKRFDLIVKRKEIQYQELLKELEQLQQKVTARKENLQSWKDPDFKQQNLKKRLEKLVSGEEEFTWR